MKETAEMRISEIKNRVLSPAAFFLTSTEFLRIVSICVERTSAVTISSASNQFSLPTVSLHHQHPVRGHSRRVVPTRNDQVTWQTRVADASYHGLVVQGDCMLPVPGAFAFTQRPCRQRPQIDSSSCWSEITPRARRLNGGRQMPR